MIGECFRCVLSGRGSRCGRRALSSGHRRRRPRAGRGAVAAAVFGGIAPNMDVPGVDVLVISSSPASHLEGSQCGHGVTNSQQECAVGAGDRGVLSQQPVSDHFADQDLYRSEREAEFRGDLDDRRRLPQFVDDLLSFELEDRGTPRSPR